MRPTLLLISALIFLGSCNTANDLLNYAQKAIAEGRYREAIAYLDRAIDKKRNFAEAYLEKGHCYTQLNRDDSAIAVYEKVLFFSRGNTLAFYNIGLCQYRQKQFQSALTSFKNAMKTKGYDSDDSLRSGYTFEFTPGGKTLLGIDDRFDVPFSELIYMAGLCEYESGNIESAYQYLQNCIRRNVFLQECHYMVGLCWLAADNKEKACESLRSSSFFGYQPAIDELAKTCK
jgi:tetratricopeptide (TPR) repeat protein